MPATGIAVVSAKQLDGWKRFVPLFVGLWFPVTVIIARTIFASTNTELFITSLYSIIVWSLMGFVVYSTAKEEPRAHVALAPSA